MSTFRYTFESKLDLFNKRGFLEENVKVPRGKEGGEGRKPTELQILVRRSENSHGSSGKVKGHHIKRVPRKPEGARGRNFPTAM